MGRNNTHPTQKKKKKELSNLTSAQTDLRPTPLTLNVGHHFHQKTYTQLSNVILIISFHPCETKSLNYLYLREIIHKIVDRKLLPQDQRVYIVLHTHSRVFVKEKKNS